MKPIHNDSTSILHPQIVVSHHKVNDLNETNSQLQEVNVVAKISCESSQS